MNEIRHEQNNTLEVPDSGIKGSLTRGMDVIKNYLKTLDAQPGVYRMLNEKGDVLYVGKAKSLKKRVANYTTPQRLTIRIQRMISQTYAMEFITTHTEAEALLLESNLIKKLKPRYNILLRDDKSFPMILVTGDHDYPQVLKHRGAKNRKGRYFGPFASAWAVNETLNTLQRAFCYAPVPTVFLHPAHALVCNIKSNDVPPLVSGVFLCANMENLWNSLNDFCVVTARPCKTNWRNAWQKRAKTSNLKKPRFIEIVFQQ